MLEHTSAQSAALAAELRNLVRQSELLVAALGADRDAAILELRGRLETAIALAKQRLLEMEEKARRIGEDTGNVIDAYVQANPLTVIGVAGVIGLLLGAYVFPSRAAAADDDRE
jgi:ElaB/YqjD/DUF883 family membrane-anchored ribosome-binding protein